MYLTWTVKFGLRRARARLSTQMIGDEWLEMTGMPSRTSTERTWSHSEMYSFCRNQLHQTIWVGTVLVNRTRFSCARMSFRLVWGGIVYLRTSWANSNGHSDQSGNSSSFFSETFCFWFLQWEKLRSFMCSQLLSGESLKPDRPELVTRPRFWL